MLYLIEFLHQTTTVIGLVVAMLRCILLNFYIKPQHLTVRQSCSEGCILLNFYIKPQQPPQHSRRPHRCILLNFYIKPQLDLINGS